MELREGKVRITRKEMREIKRMDHGQLEEKLGEAYKAGHLDGRKEQGREAERQQEDFRRAVEETLIETKGIGPGRRELFLERLEAKTGKPCT